jgi:radical SAM superfamily enzyme
MDRSVVKGSSMIINCTLNVPMLMPTIPEDWEISTCLENFNDIDYSDDSSVVFLSTTSSDLVHAYHVARKFKDLGKKIFFGGHSDTMSLNVMKLICDSVYWGIPDKKWTTAMLEDVLNDAIQTEYRCGINIDFPFDYSVFNGEKIDHLIVVSSVGCKNGCDYCQHTVQYDRTYKLRDIDYVIEDMKSIKKYANIAAFRDSNFYNEKDYVMQLCDRIIEEKLDMKWGAQCPITIGKNTKLLKRMYQAGCRALFIGYETLNQENLKSVNKPSRVDSYLENTRNIRDAGIYVIGYFVFGWDHDTRDAFREVYDFVRETKMSLPIINMYTPVPGTRFFNRLVEENRVDLPAPEDFVETDLIYSIPCNCCHYIPQKASSSELEQEFMKLYRKFTTPGEILRRSKGANLPESIALLKMNLNLRFERRKLDLSLKLKNNPAAVRKGESKVQAAFSD